MKRREFLKSGLLSAASLSGAVNLGWSTRAFSASGAVTFPRTLVHVMLSGGADFRFVFVPHPTYDPIYVDQFWSARRGLYIQKYSDYPTMYESEYLTVQDSSTNFSFGIHKSCAWLAQQFEAGNVAITANIFGSLNRRHDHSQLIVNTGDVNVGRLEIDRDGWGGRFVEATDNISNVLSVSNDVPIFCRGSEPGNRLNRVFHGKDIRNLALPEIDPTKAVTDSKNILTRALMSYYKERGSEIETEKPITWPYRGFFQHNKFLRNFGSSVMARLADNPLPVSLTELNLIDNGFELQCRNLYDSCLTQDIFNSRVISMEYGGWDHHGLLQANIVNNLQDVFGANGGLNIVSDQIEMNQPQSSDNLVYVFGSDFGRQLASNGGKGTDHGRASYSIVIGKAVNGGTYGELFPQREVIPDPLDSLNRTPFEIPGSDIAGLTSFERVLSKACDWAAPGTGPIVFPDAATSKLESTVNLDNMFAA